MKCLKAVLQNIFFGVVVFSLLQPLAILKSNK